MFSILALSLLLMAAAPAAAEEWNAGWADEDDPKFARTIQAHDEPAPPPEEDEGHPAPSLKLAWRRLTLPGLDGSPLPIDAGELELYPISTRWFRVAIDAEFGVGKGMLEGRSIGVWSFVSGLDIGFQYPWRVTPFVDARLVGGIIGGDIAGSSAISWMYTYGIDAGVELYLVDRLFVSGAIGWAHSDYKGIDVAYSKLHPLDEPHFLDFVGDSVTFKVGLGL